MSFFGIRLGRPSDKSTATPQEVAGEQLAMAVAVCPSCRSNLANHQYATLATMAIDHDREDRVLTFVEAFQQGRWLDLASFDSWHAETDNLEAYAIKCPGGNLSVAAMKSHFELLLGNQLIASRELSAPEEEGLLSAFQHLEWHPFPTVRRNS